MPKKCCIWPAVGATLLPCVGGLLGNHVFRDSVDDWYEKLKHPAWRPSSMVYCPVWTSVYCGMGYASYMVWRDGGGFNGPARLPLVLYGTQLALNWAWSPIFFGTHSLKWSLVDMSVLWLNVAACGCMFYKVNPTAGLIFAPYLVWLSFAAALNYAMYRDNPSDRPH